MNILITGCSKHSKGIIDCLRNNPDREDIFVVGVDCNEKNLLTTGVNEKIVVPRIDDPVYVFTLKDICKKYKIDVIIPYITRELELLSKHKYEFEEIGTKISVADIDSLKIVNDKIELQKKFGKYMPAQVVPACEKDIIDFIRQYGNGNVCCKITNGCGGAGFAIIDNDKAYDMQLFNRSGVNRYVDDKFVIDVMNHSDWKNEIIIQEYIKGLDYSTCALSDCGKLIDICGYVGYKMEYGAVVSGMIQKYDAAYEIHKEIIESTGLDGNSCADFIIGDDGRIVLLEINPRINASLSFVAAAGANLVYNRCKALMGGTVAKSDIRYGLRMNKFYECEYF